MVQLPGRLLLLAAILWYLPGYGQQGIKPPLSYPIITLRTSLTSFAERDGNLGIGMGYQPQPHWAFTLEPAYIFFSTHNNTEDNSINKLSGIKIRADVRYYFNKPDRGLFIAPEFHYKQVAYDETDVFGVNCVDNQCAFFQLATYKKRKREMGVSLKLGGTLKISKKLDTELFIGLGAKTKRFTRTDLPLGGVFLEDPDNRGFIFLNTDVNGSYLMMPAGVKLIYRLRG